jgi:hypothetical protein
MTVFTEGQHAGEFIVSEANGTLSREIGTLITGQTLKAGTVLGTITLSGKWTQYDQDGTDGSEVATGILFGNTDATSADHPCVGIVRMAEVNGAELVWPADIDAAEKTAAIAQLAALGLIVR